MAQIQQQNQSRKQPNSTSLVLQNTWHRFKMGSMMGALVGGTTGTLLGAFSVLRHGHGGAGFIPTIGRTALYSGSFFGLIMGIGSVVRSDDDLSCVRDQYQGNTFYRI